MKNQPLLFSIVIGIIVVFVIVGASLAAKLSNVNKLYRNESIKSMELAKENELLKKDISSLKDENTKLIEDKATLAGVIESLKEDIAEAKIEVEKLKKIKEVFEEKLKEELTKKTSEAEETR